MVTQLPEAFGACLLINVELDSALMGAPGSIVAFELLNSAGSAFKFKVPSAPAALEDEKTRRTSFRLRSVPKGFS